MKRLFILFGFLSLLAGCDRSNVGPAPVINLDPDQKEIVLVPGVGARYDVRFTSAASWMVDFFFAEDNEGWVSVSDTCGTGGYKINKLDFVVEPNTSGERRAMWLIINSGTLSRHILFTQGPYVSGLPKYVEPGSEDESEDGSEEESEEDSVQEDASPVFRLVEDAAEVGAQGGTIYVAVQHSMEYECTLASDWIIEIRTRADSYEENVHIFEVFPNVSGEERSAVISFCADGTSLPFTVTQKAVNSSR